MTSSTSLRDRIAQTVKDLIALFAVHHDLLGPKHRKMLRCICLFNSELLNELSRRQRSVAQQLDNRNSSRVAQSLKDLSFEAAKGIGHIDSICECSNIRKYAIYSREGRDHRDRNGLVGFRRLGECFPEGYDSSRQCQSLRPENRTRYGEMSENGR